MIEKVALPQLDPALAEINDQLVQLLAEEMQARGPMRFSEYMHRCLYEPGLGYYVNGLSKLGVDGDFVTAPELSEDFAHCVANQCAEVLAISGGGIMEFGGGSGRLAVDILCELDRLQSLPEQYFLLDVSGDLQNTQRQLIQAELPDHLASRVCWVDKFVDDFCGVVLANELFDAFPVEQFCIVDDVAMLGCVDWTGDQFVTTRIADDKTVEHVSALEAAVGGPFDNGYVSEFCPVLAPWWKSLADSLQCGTVLVFDYGSERSRYYSTLRSSGSVRCFYRHTVHSDVCIYQGVQDITADVDFTALAEAAISTGFELEGFTSLSSFMLSLGAIDRLQKNTEGLDDRERFRVTGKAKQLLLPEEMGERFMVAGFSKNITPALRGFSLSDLSRLL